MRSITRITLYTGTNFVVFFLLWYIVSYMVTNLGCDCRLSDYGPRIFGFLSVILFFGLSVFDCYLVIKNRDNIPSKHIKGLISAVALYFLVTVVLFSLPYMGKSDKAMF